jgi:serine/threonine-protein kinase HipA
MKLFGVRTAPHLDVDLTELYAQAAKLAGKMSISGVQIKLSMKVSEDQLRLETVAAGGRYILKPPPAVFPNLAENESLTMRLADIVGIEIPSHGLIHLKDGTRAYIIKRFDRTEDGGKLQVEDFCQLAGIPAAEKYTGSAELCVRLLRQFADEPLIEIRKLFRLLLFSWWVCNGDLHLKNLSMLTKGDKYHQLSPAYDLVNTRLVIPDDHTLSLSICGKKDALTRRTWLDFAAYCGLPAKAAETLLSTQIDALGAATGLIQQSFLPAARKNQYAQMIAERTDILKNKPAVKSSRP